MKISYNWLKNYVQTNLSAERVGELLTAGGLEVEDIEAYESIKGGLEGVIVGEVNAKAAISRHCFPRDFRHAE